MVLSLSLLFMMQTCPAYADNLKPVIDLGTFEVVTSGNSVSGDEGGSEEKDLSKEKGG